MSDEFIACVVSEDYESTYRISMARQNEFKQFLPSRMGPYWMMYRSFPRTFNIIAVDGNIMTKYQVAQLKDYVIEYRYSEVPDFEHIFQDLGI